jgi:hypothetical protein
MAKTKVKLPYKKKYKDDFGRIHLDCGIIIPKPQIHLPEGVDLAQTGGNLKTVLFAKGKLINMGVATIGSGVSAVASLVTAGYQWLTCIARIGNATTPAAALGDCNFGLGLFEDDGTTTVPPNSGAFSGVDLTVIPAAFTTPYAFRGLRYNLAGLDMVRAILNNANAGALQGGTVTYFLQG